MMNWCKTATAATVNRVGVQYFFLLHCFLGLLCQDSLKRFGFDATASDRQGRFEIIL